MLMCHQLLCRSLFFFAVVNVTVKWSAGLKEQVFTAVIFSVIVMFFGYLFHCINYKPCCQVDNSGGTEVTLTCFIQTTIMLKLTAPRGALSPSTFHAFDMFFVEV